MLFLPGLFGTLISRSKRSYIPVMWWLQIISKLVFLVNSYWQCLLSREGKFSTFHTMPYCVPEKSNGSGRYKTQATGHCFNNTESIINIHKS